MLRRQQQTFVPLNGVGYFVSVHHLASFELLRAPWRRAWFRRFLERLHAKVFVAERDQDRFARIDWRAMCPGVEIVREHNAADHSILNGNLVDLHLLARHPFPSIRAESRFSWVIEHELMSFLKPLAG